MNANLSALLYLVAGVLFILSLRGLSSPVSSRRGNLLGMIGMAIAIATTSATSSTVGTSTLALPLRLSLAGFEVNAIKVWFLVFVELSAALNHRGRRTVRSRRLRLMCRRSLCFRRRRRSTAHLRPLFFQDRLARQLDAIAFDGQHLHQHLVAFF